MKLLVTAINTWELFIVDEKGSILVALGILDFPQFENKLSTIGIV